jgi:hypothetical protein
VLMFAHLAWCGKSRHGGGSSSRAPQNSLIYAVRDCMSGPSSARDTHVHVGPRFLVSMIYGAIYMRGS